MFISFFINSSIPQEKREISWVLGLSSILWVLVVEYIFKVGIELQGHTL